MAGVLADGVWREDIQERLWDSHSVGWQEEETIQDRFVSHKEYVHVPTGTLRYGGM